MNTAIILLTFSALFGLSLPFRLGEKGQSQEIYRRIGIQGAPLQHGQPKPGVQNGPDLIRRSEIIPFLKGVGHDVKDYGDIDLGLQYNLASVGLANEPINNPDEVSNATLRISNATKKILNDGRFPLTFGGDHALAIGTINAMMEHYPDLSVIYIDAHGDINTVETTPSGNLHGMPLSFVIKELNPLNVGLPQFSWVVASLSAAHVGHIALRDVDRGEINTMEGLGMPILGMRDVDRYGILGVWDMIISRISGRTRPVYISMDIDSLDDLEIGDTTGTPVAGGLKLREVLTMFEEMNRTGINLVGFELTEVNPSLGDEHAGNRTAKVCRHILACVFGSCQGHWP